MSFGNAAVFPFPAIQYIPLQLTEICRKKIQAVDQSTPVQLIVGKSLKKWVPILQRNYQITLKEDLPENSLPLLVLNARINSARYRGYFITMLGNMENGYYHLLTMPLQYFYKKQLYFELFDECTSRLLAKCALPIPG